MRSKNLLINTGLSVFIWIGTNLLSAAILLSARIGGFDFEMLNCDWCASELHLIILAGFIISFPVNFFLVPSLYILSSLPSRRDRIIYASTSVLMLSLFVIAFFFVAFQIPSGNRTNIIILLTPYVFSAQLCFWMLARKKIFTQPKRQMINPYHSFLNKH